MASKYPPSRQVTVGTFGTRTTLHALTAAGFARLAARHTPGTLLELVAGFETVAAAGAFGGVARPADGAVVAHLGNPLTGGGLPHPGGGLLVLFDPQLLTDDARVQAETSLSAAGPTAAGRFTDGTLVWGRVEGALERFAATRSVTGDRIVAVAHAHDAAVTTALLPVNVSGELLDAVGAETGVASSPAARGGRTAIYRGVTLTAPALEVQAMSDFDDWVLTMSGSPLQGTLEQQPHHVLSGDPREQVAATYAQLRDDGMDQRVARESAEALTD